ncbi:effector-associated constant component EACC1 [Streptomyces sp. WAC01526]|uniref:effector-associated constant component EACC1 n=1 Tax=unclassified Streptomyces TaxID=2593676 RepID=UPI0011DFC229|nr:hypothetical protein [Streptomyces sp. WAC01526]
MRIEIRVSGAGGREQAALSSLHDWLRAEPTQRRDADIGLVGPQAQHGEMGAALDWLQLITENGWSVAGFVLALKTWLQTRPAAQRPTLTVRIDDRTTVTVEGRFDEDELTALRQVLETAQSGRDAR